MLMTCLHPPMPCMDFNEASSWIAPIIGVCDQQHEEGPMLL